MTQTEALKLALEALAANEFALIQVGQRGNGLHIQTTQAITAIKEALAQPEQETDDLTIAYMAGLSRGKDLAQQRKQLTDDEAFKLIEQDYQMEEYAQAALQLIRRTEDAHGIKE